jgi:uncharacterized repeat protein (TIGR01451 family)
MTRRAALLFSALSLLLLEPAVAQSRAAAYGQLPMRFEANRGQTDPRVRFVARGAGYAFFITDTETVAVLQKGGAAPAVIRMQLAGASDRPRVEGGARFEGKSNYLIGSDPAKWRVNVPQFGNVRMSEVYRGIDAVYYGNQGEIEYDFLVAPGSDPGQIRMRFEGAERIDVDAAGDLVLRIAGGEIRQRAPFVYQERNGSRRVVEARYRRNGAREFGIAVGKYDRALPLIIDPVLAWSTYLGGSDSDAAFGLTVDAAGNAYVTGNTASINFPTANALQTANGGGIDAFVTKLNAAGNALVYSTYLGGSGDDFGRGVVVDGAGNAYVAGYTGSANFPTVNAIQAANGGGIDAFVTKLNAAGTALLYSSYLGGSANEQAFAIEVDVSGNAYVAGNTASVNFPTANAVQAASGGGGLDGFVTKLNAAGSALVYSTYLGGSTFDAASDLAVDGTGSAYVTGVTTSTDFPTVNALQAANAGSLDGFVTKFNAAGSALVYSTYLGGSDGDQFFGVAIDGLGNAYVAGSTASTNFPTANALQAANAAGFDAFAAKLNAAGSALVYSTYLGGFGQDAAYAVAVDVAGNAYLTGRTGSIDFPTANALQPALAGAFDAFMTTLNPAGSALVDSTYLGGTGSDEGRAIAVDGTGVYVAGFTGSSDFPTASPLQGSYGGGVQDAFVTKLAEANADLEIEKTATGAFVAGQDGTFTITVTNNGPTQATGVTVTDTIPAGATFVSATPSQGSCNAASPVTCALGTIDNGDSATIALVVRPASDGPLSNTADVAATTPDPNPANDSSTAIAQVAGSANLSIVKTAAGPFFAGMSGTFTITVTNGGPTAAAGVTVADILPAGVTFVSATPSQGTCNAASPVVCNLGTIGNGGMATIALVVQPTAAGPLSNTATVTSSTADVDPANNGSTALVTVQPASAFAAIPALDGRALMLLAALLAGVGMLIAGRR